MASSLRIFNDGFLNSQKAKARTVFLAALGLLCLCAIGTYLSFSYFKESDSWVAHTQEVRAAVGDLEAAVNNGARARMAYLMSGDEAALTEYQAATSQISEPMRRLGELTKDNPVQVDNYARLDATTTARLQAWRVSVEEKQSGKPTDLAALMRQNMEFSSRSALLTGAIRSEENHLLGHRTSAARRGFVLASVVVISSFVVALFLLYLHFRLLQAELRATERAEHAAVEAYTRGAALHQEAERFRLFVETVKDYAIFTLDSEGRVTSWNNGAERLKRYAASEIIGKNFSCFFPGDQVQMGEPQRELDALFRVLQESLTNVHRHSGSSTANVRLSMADATVVLQIRDEGKGISPKLLEESGQDWLGSLGVGVRGMSERIRQLGGKLEVASTATGTTVTARVPVARAAPV